ncbi:DUF305 domain-containing protein [Cyanobium sp. N5-Cardenillas]|nr:DUF305 domain-containing protein [Cyanobium sp. N5-Cardenillas]
MDKARSSGVHTRATARRLAAVAGLGALCLVLGIPALADPPTVAAPMGSGMGHSLMGGQPMDQHFIVMMIPHHDGAIAMADLALGRARRPEIKALARSIKDSQTQENAQMRTWYRQWFGGSVPAWGGAMGHGGGMGMMGMGGLGGTGTDVAWLKNASDFDRAFIEQMIPHHRMGVMMASMAQTNSQHPQLQALEQAMVTAQSQEIEQMAQWYRSWYGTS